MKSLPFLILGGICVWLIVITFLIVSCTSGHAQSTNTVPLPVTSQEVNLMQQFYDSTIGTSNGVFVATAARKLTGNANRFSLDYLYSFNNNAALVLGIDDIRSGGYSQANILKGGLNLKADIYPLKNFGVTNFFVTPYAFALAATPVSGTSNNGGIGQLAGTGIAWEHSFTKNLSMELGGFFENSSGEGTYSGNWVGVLAGVHYHF